MVSAQEETLNPNKPIKNPGEIYWLFRGLLEHGRGEAIFVNER